MLQDLIKSGREAQRTGAWDDALAHYQTALTLLPEGDDPKSRAELLRWIGTVHTERGVLDEAATHFGASKAAADEANLREQSAAALVSMANVELLRGNLEPAVDLFLQARVISEEIGHDRLVAMIDQNLGTIANIQGNVALALLSYRSALERYRRLNDDFTATRALNNMGMAHVDLA
jgi:tetratricopeptide (TPR) repeat protein